MCKKKPHNQLSYYKLKKHVNFPHVKISIGYVDMANNMAIKTVCI